MVQPYVRDIVHIQEMRKVVPPIQNIVGIRKQITILIIHRVISRLVAPLKFIYCSIQVSDVLLDTGSINLILNSELFEVEVRPCYHLRHRS
jgi:hypothetical protein